MKTIPRESRNTQKIMGKDSNPIGKSKIEYNSIHPSPLKFKTAIKNLYRFPPTFLWFSHTLSHHHTVLLMWFLFLLLLFFCFGRCANKHLTSIMKLPLEDCSFCCIRFLSQKCNGMHTLACQQYIHLALWHSAMTYNLFFFWS